MTTRQYQQNTSNNHRYLIQKTSAGTPSLTSHQHLPPSHNHKNKNNLSATIDSEHLSTIHKENSLLREENRALKRELNLIKGDSMMMNMNEHEFSEVGDLRETIKKQAGLIKELKTRIQVLSKQCKMYEDIIDKMEGKINKLNESNKELERKVGEYRIREKFSENSGGDTLGLRKTYEPDQLSSMRDKIHEIIVMYTELENRVLTSEEEWESYKEKWGKEKTYYIHRIHDLEELMGIRKNDSKEIFKKRQ